MLQQHLYHSEEEQNRTGEKHTVPVKNVLRRIRCDYAKPLTLEMLAQEAWLEPHYLCRVFRQMTGRTPVDYLNYYRIECAAELLCAGQESITEIALSCGFGDPGYFTRVFRRQKGVSAREWRNTHSE